MRLSALIAVLLWLAAPSFAQTHPSLFFDASQVDALRQRAVQAAADPNGYYADTWNEILIDCRSTYGPGDPVPHTEVWRNYQAIVCHAALLLLDPVRAANATYQSDQRFFSYFWANLNDARWSNFFSNDRLNAPWLLQGLCIGYDWHYDKFTPAERADIVSKLAARADYLVANASTFFPIPADLNHPTLGYQHTFKVLTNRQCIPVAPLAVVAYTLEGEVASSRRQGWLNKFDEVYNAWASKVAPDGISHEGYGYHEYLTNRWGPMIYSKFRRTGVNLYKQSSYLYNEPMASLYSLVPGGDRFFLQSMPLADVIEAPPAEVRTGDALAAAMLKGEPDHRDQVAAWLSYKPLSGAANNNYSRQDITQFFWGDASVGRQSPQQLNLPLFRWFPDRGVFVWRSGWDDMATYFNLTCGPVIGGHQHPENGAFQIFKGGSPFIAHQGYSRSRRTEQANVMMIGGQGQFGDRYEDGNGTTQALPSTQWPAIERVVADDAYFNVYCNLKANYREAKLQSYGREFVGIDGYIFVRDRLQASSAVQADAYLHAYSTQHPASPPDPFAALNIDTMPTVNPWSGTGRVHYLQPRQPGNGPFSGTMTVLDLSNQSWTATVSPAIINNIDNAFVQRGNKLVSGRSTSNGSLLMAYYFPGADQIAPVWPDPAQGEGTVISRNGADRIVQAWPGDGTMDNSNGMTIYGAMGGVALDTGAYWGRDITRLARNGVAYFVSNVPVSVYSLGSQRFRLLAPQAASISLRHPQPVSQVQLDFQTIPAGQWQWSNGTLTLTIPASSGQRILTTTIAPTLGRQDVLNYILGIASSPAGLDFNADGKVDVADAIYGPH